MTNNRTGCTWRDVLRTRRLPLGEPCQCPECRRTLFRVDLETEEDTSEPGRANRDWREWERSRAR